MNQPICHGSIFRKNCESKCENIGSRVILRNGKVMSFHPNDHFFQNCYYSDKNTKYLFCEECATSNLNDIVGQNEEKCDAEGCSSTKVTHYRGDDHYPSDERTFYCLQHSGGCRPIEPGFFDTYRIKIIPAQVRDEIYAKERDFIRKLIHDNSLDEFEDLAEELLQALHWHNKTKTNKYKQAYKILAFTSLKTISMSTLSKLVELVCTSATQIPCFIEACQSA